mmetsp:Transcript_38518/g.46969  ORF Transcript_38518/g.46969 Transcript_38518/m.46969 type:complete len:414 (+) Transcript_38518:191-1432(+)
MDKFAIKSINVHTYPNGRKPLCEITGRPATVALVTPHTTLYYATLKHAELSQKLIIPKISRDWALLRSPVTVLGPQSAAKEHDTLKTSLAKKLAQFCLDDAAKISDDDDDDDDREGQYIAVLHALSFLRQCPEGRCADEQFVLPHDDTTVVPYLLLAEAYLGLSSSTTTPPPPPPGTNLLSQVEKCLSAASHSIFNAGTPPPRSSSSTTASMTTVLQSRLHRNYGKLRLKQMRPREALADLAKDAYCSSVAYGPESVRAAGAYFLMGRAFGQLDDETTEMAFAFYDKVVEIWIVALNGTGVKKSCGGGVVRGSFVSTEQLREALDMFLTILRDRKGLRNEVNSVGTGRTYYCLGLCHKQLGNLDEALSHFLESLAILRENVGERHDLTRQVMHDYNSLKHQQSIDKKAEKQGI